MLLFSFYYRAYGDSIFMLIQTAIVALLVLLFSGKALEAVAYLAIHGSLLWFLFLSGLAPFDAIWALQAANMPIAAASKVRQEIGLPGQTSMMELSPGLLYAFITLCYSHQCNIPWPKIQEL